MRISAVTDSSVNRLFTPTRAAALDIATERGVAVRQLVHRLRVRRLRRRRMARSLCGGLRRARSAPPAATVPTWNEQAPQTPNPVMTQAERCHGTGAGILGVARPSAPIAARRSCAARADCRAHPITCSATTTTARSPIVTEPGPASPTRRASTASASRGSTWTTTGSSTCCVANDSGPTASTGVSGTARSRTSAMPLAPRSMATGAIRRAWASAIGDYDNDGRDDVHITNFADDFSVLYHNAGGAQLQPTPASAPAWRQASIPFLGWGSWLSRLRQRAGWLDLLRRQRARLSPLADRMDWNTPRRGTRAALSGTWATAGSRIVGLAAGPGLTTPATCARGSARLPTSTTTAASTSSSTTSTRLGGSAPGERRHGPGSLADAA